MRATQISSAAASPPQTLAGDILSFPLWWYTRGALHSARVIFAPVRFLSQYLALPVLGANLTQPLFGDVTQSGRLVSVFVRLGHFIVLASGVGLVGLVLGVVYVVWLLLPALAAFHIIRIGVFLFLP